MRSWQAMLSEALKLDQEQMQCLWSNRGESFSLLGWQRLFPSGLVRGQPEVGLAVAWGLALAIRYDEALERVIEVERDIDAHLS